MNWYVVLILFTVSVSQPANVYSNDFSVSNHDQARSRIRALMDEGFRLKYIRTAAADDSAHIKFDSALHVAIASFGYQDTMVASAMNEVANCVALEGDFSAADSMLVQAIGIWEKCVGPDHPANGRGLISRGFICDLSARPTEAERLFLEAIALYDRLPEFDPHNRGLAKNALGCLYDKQHNSEALTLLREATTIWKRHYGEASFWVGIAETNIGNYYGKRSSWDSSKVHLRRAIETLEESVGPVHLMLSWALGTLGEVCIHSGDYACASENLRKSLEMIESIYGADDLPGSMSISDVLYSLTRLEFNRGNYELAAEYADRMLEAQGERMEYGYGDVAVYLGRAALSYFGSGDYEKSMAIYHKALEVRHDFVSSVFDYASEEQKMRFLRKNPLIDDRFLSIALSIGSRQSLTDACEMVLTGKAAVVDAMSAEKEAAYCTADTSIEILLVQHAAVCKEIASATISGMSISSIQVLEDSLQSLTDIKNQLESQISLKCSDFRNALIAHDVSVEAVASSLASDAVLWEFCRYWPLQTDSLSIWHFTPAHYLVLVLNNLGEIVTVDLGDATLVDSMVTDFLAMMSDAPRLIRESGERKSEQQLAAVSSRLYDLVISPIEAATGEYEEIFISPEGQLSILPFSTLISPDGQYLIERCQVNYLSSGRDLLPVDTEDKKYDNRAIVFMDPDYERQATPLLAQATKGESVGTPLSMRGPSNRTECLAVPFDPLPATKIEGDTVSSILNKLSDMVVDQYSASRASEILIKSIETSPRVLHLATHGYFCDNVRFSGSGLVTENPLLYSGLALAGANEMILGDRSPESAPEDGILTALEASGLNLVGTELVVLSSCQSGAGRVVQAEGVYGLRRAFQHAGARSIIMSMFDIPDQSTAVLMQRFYTNWLTGVKKSTALREASLSMLEERREVEGAAHPLYWGGFILVGDPD